MERLPSAQPLPPFHFEVLNGKPTCSSAKGSRQKVILLHGWHQDCEAWRQTALGLQEGGGHDVLLIDFYNHGKSQGIYPFYRCNVNTLVAQVSVQIQIEFDIAHLLTRNSSTLSCHRWLSPG